MGPEDPRYARALAKALEFTRQRTEKLISEARKRGCLYYKAGEEIGPHTSHSVTLHLTDADNIKYRRTISCHSFFEAEGIYFSLDEASRLRAEVDRLFDAAGGFNRYHTAAYVRQERRRKRP